MLDLIVMAGGEAPPKRIDADIFGPWAKAERQARGLTQAAVAQRAGISRAALANVERAEYAAGVDLQRRLGAIFSEVAA